MRHVHFVVAIALVVLGGPASPALADPPANDARAAATALSPPGGVTGTTAGSTLEGEESVTVQGESVSGSVWYTFHTSQARRVVLRLAAAGNLDAGLEVYRRARSQLKQEQSQLTGENGRADIIFDSRGGATYLVRVAQRTNSVPGGFRLDVYLPRLFPSAPGARLPKAGVSGRVDGLDNAADAYSTILRAGITYRINLANLSSHRLVLSVFAPGTTSFQSDEPIRSGPSYVLITPGVGEGGRYSFVVSSSRVTSRQDYRLQVGRAGPDDQFPGRVLPNQRRVRGTLNARGLDAVDVYRFDIVHRSTVAITLSTASANDVGLQLRTAGGRRGRRLRHRRGGGAADVEARTLRPAGARPRCHPRPLHAAAGRADVHPPAHRRREHGPLGTPATLRLTLPPGESGPARVTIERHDPFGGWLFARRAADDDRRWQRDRSCSSRPSVAGARARSFSAPATPSPATIVARTRRANSQPPNGSWRSMVTRAGPDSPGDRVSRSVAGVPSWTVPPPLMRKRVNIRATRRSL